MTLTETVYLRQNSAYGSKGINFGLMTKLSIRESSKVDLVQSMSYQ